MVAFRTSDGIRCYGHLYFKQPTQRLSEGENLTVIIPAASGRRMRSFGCRSLLELRHNETVLSRQLSLLKNRFPLAEFIVVAGFEEDRLYRAVPKDVRIVVNELHEETSVVRSLDLALKVAAPSESALIVYGDLVFNRATLANCPTDKSWVLVDQDGQFNQLEVGLTIVDDEATRFAYNLPAKWAQIAFLQKDELKVFRELVAMKERHKQFTFELLNEVLDVGGTLTAHSPPQMKIAEIDCSKDLELAQRIR